MNLEHITTLEELRTEVENFDGCALKKNALKTVFCDGQPDADIMLIGEAPGKDEDEQGKPFVGRSGRLLRSLFEDIGYTSDKNLYITNMMFWRPPENRTPTKKELKTTEHFVRKHIALVQPKAVVLVGNVPSQTLLKTKAGVTKIHGTWQELDLSEHGLKVRAMPLYHPAYLLRSPSKKPEAQADLQKLKAEL